VPQAERKNLILWNKYIENDSTTVDLLVNIFYRAGMNPMRRIGLKLYIKVILTNDIYLN